MNETIKVIHDRVSLRRYADKPISQEHLDLIIESMMKAPTAGNMMLYSILLIEDQDMKKKLSITCDNQPFIAEAPVAMVFLADFQRWFDYYEYSQVPEFCREKGLDYHGPDQGDLMLAANDAIIAAQNGVIAAESLGIGSCYIGDIMENYETHRELLNLPDWAFPITMLCFGYYPEGMKKVHRRRFDRQYIVFNEKYRRLSPVEFDQMYAEHTGKSYANPYGAENYGQLMYARKTGSEFAKEMARSVKEAMKYWVE